LTNSWLLTILNGITKDINKSIYFKHLKPNCHPSTPVNLPVNPGGVGGFAKPWSTVNGEVGWFICS